MFFLPNQKLYKLHYIAFLYDHKKHYDIGLAPVDCKCLFTTFKDRVMRHCQAGQRGLFSVKAEKLLALLLLLLSSHHIEKSKK